MIAKGAMSGASNMNAHSHDATSAIFPAYTYPSAVPMGMAERNTDIHMPFLPGGA